MNPEQQWWNLRLPEWGSSVTLEQILAEAYALTRTTVFDRGSNWVELPGPPEPLPPHAAVTIVGGGVMGVSTACQLARAGVGNILVIERNVLGSGSSAKPLGGVRATFSDPGNILLAQPSLAAFERFGVEFGVDIALRQVGYLFLCRTEKELAAVESSTELQNRLGGSSEMVSAGQAAQLNPFIDPSVLLGASFSPRDGYADPGQVVRGYADAARSLGVVFSEQTEVTAIDTWEGMVTAVRTSHGLVRTEAVIYRWGLVAAHRRDGWDLVARGPGPPADRLHRTADAADAHGAVHPRSGQHLVLPQRPRRSVAGDLRSRS